MRLNWQRFLNTMIYISKFLSSAVALTTVFFISNSYGQNSPPPRASSPPPLESSSPQVKAKDKVSIGTGFFITDNGYLITSNHVINKFSSIFVIFPDSRKLPAKLIRFDEVNDLALLKVDAITSFLYLSHSQGVPAGMEVVTIGYPHVGIQGFAPKITQGIVNSPSGLKDDKNSFQFSAEVQKGNSGGPLIGPGGTVVGVVRSKLNALLMSQNTNDLSQNVNFATKSIKLLDLVKDLPNLPTTRNVDPEQPMRPIRIYSESKISIYPVLALDSKEE